MGGWVQVLQQDEWRYKSWPAIVVRTTRRSPGLLGPSRETKVIEEYNRVMQNWIFVVLLCSTLLYLLKFYRVFTTLMLNLTSQPWTKNKAAEQKNVHQEKPASKKKKKTCHIFHFYDTIKYVEFHVLFYCFLFQIKKNRRNWCTAAVEPRTDAGASGVFSRRNDGISMIHAGRIAFGRQMRFSRFLFSVNV